MNKERLRQKLTEITAYKFDMLEQLFEGKWPPFKNNGMARYAEKDLPPPYVKLKTFKNDVNDYVSVIMRIIDEEGEGMTDPIAYELWGHGFSTEEKCERFAKQIRQQIGRELEQLTLDDGSINEEAWRKVCKMEEDKR